MKSLLIIFLLCPSLILGAKPFDEWARPGPICKFLEQSLQGPAVEAPAPDFMSNVGNNIVMNIAVSMGMGVLNITGKMLIKGGEMALNQIAQSLRDDNAQATVNVTINPKVQSSSPESADHLVENMTYEQLIMLAATEEGRPESSRFWREKLYNRRIQMNLIDPEEY